jgi:hypothetical protein
LLRAEAAVAVTLLVAETFAAVAVAVAAGT